MTIPFNRKRKERDTVKFPAGTYKNLEAQVFKVQSGATDADMSGANFKKTDYHTNVKEPGKIKKNEAIVIDKIFAYIDGDESEIQNIIDMQLLMKLKIGSVEYGDFPLNELLFKKEDLKNNYENIGKLENAIVIGQEDSETTYDVDIKQFSSSAVTTTIPMDLVICFDAEEYAEGQFTKE